MNLQPQTYCEAYWRGQRRRFALALHQEYIHFWEPDSPEFQAAPEEWVWVVEGEVQVLKQTVINPRFLEVTFLHGLECDGWGRRFWLSERSWVRLMSNGIGVLIGPHPGCSTLWQASFRFDAADKLASHAHEWWLEQVEQWTQQDSDYAFVLRWAPMDEEDQAKELVLFARGDWAELERGARWILNLDGELKDSLLATIDLKKDEVTWRVQSGERGYTPKRPALWQAWFEFFAPFLDEQKIDAHLCVEETACEGRAVFLPTTLRCDTAHEQLEIRLQLRDWLRERVGLPDERIAVLLE